MITADWSIIKKTRDELRKYIGEDRAPAFTDPGWYYEPKSGDTILLEPLVGTSKYGGGAWQMSVWNGSDPRPEMARLLAMPSWAVFHTGGTIRASKGDKKS